MVFSQRAHRPAFPKVNGLIGDGQSTMMHYGLPVAHPITFFRPQTWAYFVGPDIGLAWHWGLLGAGVYLAWFWLFLLITKGRTGVSALGALVLLATPFVQFWSLNNAPALAFAALWCRATIGFVDALTIPATLGWAALGTWSALGLFFYLYPPYTIPLAGLCLAIVGGWLAERRAPVRGRSVKVGIVVVLAAASAALLVEWWTEVGEALRSLLATEYPGHRYTAGGGYDLTSLFRHDLLLPLWFSQWKSFGNVCEAASAVFLFPVVAATSVSAWTTRRTRPDPLGVALVGFIVVAVYWMTGSEHPLLAAWTPLRFVPSTRMMGALVPADVAFTVWFLSADARLRPGRVLGSVILVGWAALVVWVGFNLVRTLGAARLGSVIAAGIAVVALGGLVLSQKWQCLAGVAALCCAGTLHFNPVVRGGSHFLLENDLSRRMVEIDDSWGHTTSWIIWTRNWGLPNLPRALGIHSWSGAQVYPQSRLWRELDPLGERRSQWNRYANVRFAMSDDPTAVGIASPYLDTVVVTAAPANPVFQRLGVTHAIVAGAAEPPASAVTGLTLVGRLGRYRIYQLPTSPPRRCDAPTAG